MLPCSKVLNSGKALQDYKTHVKPTNSRTYVHASSYHPEGTRKVVIVGEIHRFCRTNSSNVYFWDQVRKHIAALINRGYCITQIKKYVKEICQRGSEPPLYEDQGLGKSNGVNQTKLSRPVPNDIIVTQKQRCYPSREGVAKPLDPQTHTEPNLIANPRGT